jgi:hypothetical protein
MATGRGNARTRGKPKAMTVLGVLAMLPVLWHEAAFPSAFPVTDNRNATLIYS